MPLWIIKKIVKLAIWTQQAKYDNDIDRVVFHRFRIQTRCFHPQTASWRFSKLTKIDLPKKIHQKLAVAFAISLANYILGLFIYNDMRSTTRSASQAHKTFPWKFEYIYQFP